MKVYEIIDEIIKKTGIEPIEYEKTCDHLIIGDKDKEVKKIVTTFMATVEVIKKAAEIGADFIITHEPTWFTANDKVEWLENDPIYLEKKKLIEENNIAIWRFHDHMHIGNEDGIYRGYEIETEWNKYRIDNPKGMEWFGASYEIPETSLRELCLFFKDKLEMDVVQIVGNPEMTVKRVGVLVGGGSLGLGIEELPMQLMLKNNLDTVICGDITEWTIVPYVRDAVEFGQDKAMLILGHERSEEMGMKHAAAWVKDIVGDIPVEFIDAKEPFKYI